MPKTWIRWWQKDEDKNPVQCNDYQTRLGSNELAVLQHELRHSIIGVHMASRKILKAVQLQMEAYRELKENMTRMEKALNGSPGEKGNDG